MMLPRSYANNPSDPRDRLSNARLSSYAGMGKKDERSYGSKNLTMRATKDLPISKSIPAWTVCAPIRALLAWCGVLANQYSYNSTARETAPLAIFHLICCLGDNSAFDWEMSRL
jgi:hypothetical protein